MRAQGRREARSRSAVTDEEQQEAEAEQDEVSRDVPCKGHRDERLHGEEAEKHSPGDADAPPDPPDPPADEAPRRQIATTKATTPRATSKGQSTSRTRFPNASSPPCPAKINTPARIAETPASESDRDDIPVGKRRSRALR